MGRNDQQRRAAQARARAKDARAGWARGTGPDGATAFGMPGAWSGGEHQHVPASSPEDEVASGLDEVLYHLRTGASWRVGAACDELCAVATEPAGRAAVIAHLAGRLGGEVDALWGRGWRPAEAHRLLARRVDAGALALAVDAMAAELDRHAPASVAPSWFAQLTDIGASVWWSRDTTYVGARALTSGGGLAAVVRDAVVALDALGRLPPVPLLDPLPGTWRPSRQDERDVDERVLERVRALLAKAESTTFEAEAETFTAGAQALMARHSIDAVMLAARRPHGSGDAPMARRVGVDRPYEAPKVLLLDAVARANRCRSVWSRDLGFVTVVGFHTDLEGVETLFTSLLVQSTSAMSAHGTRAHPGGQSRTRGFRTSFLTAFAHRIGERLQSATDDETAAAMTRPTTGRDLVRVLAERSAEVDASVGELFPALVQKSLSTASDAEGWHAGRRAADAADLSGRGRLGAT